MEQKRNHFFDRLFSRGNKAEHLTVATVNPTPKWESPPAPSPVICFDSLPKDLQLFVTLWPSFDHFPRFANDKRLVGIRLNSAMVSVSDIATELARSNNVNGSVPLYFDVKSRQMRIEKVDWIPPDNDLMIPGRLEINLNHPISVNYPTPVLFKAGEDMTILTGLENDGKTLIFKDPPKYSLKPGESICIRDKSLKVRGSIFTETELKKIAQVKSAGFNKYFLSYVESQRDVDEFLEIVGKDAEVQLKIESEKGLQYVATEYKKKPNLFLVAARGDLYVELNRPHDILDALKLIIRKDSEACAASRIMLSVVGGPVPSCADFSELAWLYDIGYRRIMLCDEICLKENLLGTAVRAVDEFRSSYCK